MNTRDLQRTPGLPLFRGINFSSLEIEGNLGGAIFTVGTVVCLVIGLPEARALFAGALAGGVLVAVAIAWWHEHHPSAGPERARHGTFGSF